jgi:hypothetical protein
MQIAREGDVTNKALIGWLPQFGKWELKKTGLLRQIYRAENKKVHGRVTIGQKQVDSCAFTEQCDARPHLGCGR